ncbi:hypothetical protein PhCBS80983_g02396 [Powellomyces hirtus]|uniref:DM2 domain-containing protein n=1 Tax=Powellomyces hirtus TaxID=109895 RepID=A0A507E738_9FUNG|nr:hypothetical protein PhCBS80983_g02396 [Powellomyces hirtus]
MSGVPSFGHPIGGRHNPAQMPMPTVPGATYAGSPYSMSGAIPGAGLSKPSAQGHISRQNSGGAAAVGTPTPGPAKRPADPTPASRPKRKRPAERIEAYIPESRIYTELQEFEKKLDTTISRKKLDMLEQKTQLKPTKRVMRIFLSNLSSDQYADVEEDRDVFTLDTMRAIAPSWTLRIEGRLLDFPNSRKPQVNPPKFSTFVRSVIVELQRDQSLYPDDNIIEWHKAENGPDCDGFEIKRKGDSDVPAKILIYLDHKPEKYKLSPPLAKLLDIHTDTAANIIIAMWQYVKFQKLQDPDDKRHINCDEALRNILGHPRITFAQISELLRPHFSPPDPIVLQYTIRTDKEHQYGQLAFDVDVETPNTQRERLEQSIMVAPQVAKDIGTLDEKITALIQAINHCKLKRDFMLAFADDPIAFLGRWMTSQSRDLESVLGDTHINMDETRRAQFFDQNVVHQAVFHHLRMRDAA